VGERMIVLLLLLVAIFVAGFILVFPEFITPRLYVLLYHRIVPDDQADTGDLLYSVTEGAFAEQMRILSAGNVDLWGLAEIQAYFDKKHRLSRPAVAVTFDDGYQSILTRGLPIIKRYKIPVILFASPYPYWQDQGCNDRILTPPELRELSTQGVEIQSHTMDHRPLSELSDSQVLAAFRQSKHELESITGQKITALAPPGNFYRRRFDELLTRSGYSLCFSADKGSNGTFDRAPMHIRRLIVEKTMNQKAFQGLISPLGAARARLLGTLKKIPLVYFTPEKWLKIRQGLLSSPLRRVFTTKGLTILGAAFLLLVAAGIILGWIIS
jgi:peptidoglycan/xylan/chitin deacetylase (PgdA/CDA1 family)